MGIVAAMAGELRPFLRATGLRRVRGGRLSVFESERFVAAYAGMGRERALEACAAVWARGEIAVMISAGWCGALAGEARAGTVQPIAVVRDAESGETFQTAESGTELVTVSRVLGAEEKRELRKRTGAGLVDMEAAHVARFAGERGAGFRAVKAVSDEHDAALPDLERFSSAEGQFATGRFVAWLSVRPRWWAAVWQMGRNAERSARALSEALQKLG